MRLFEQDTPKLYSEESFSSFLSVSPFDSLAAEQSRSWIDQQHYDRKALADLLQHYNQEIGNDFSALKQVDRLRNQNSVCVFTGQQLGLFGGPSYTVLKAISCCLLAKKYDAIPLFWLATEDHDVGEIDHTFLLDSLGNLSKIHLSLPKDGRFIEDIQLSPSHGKVISHFAELVGRADLFKSIENETSYAKVMTKALLALFKGTGLVFVEPRLLRSLAKKIFVHEIAHVEEVAKVLQSTTEKFKLSGGSPVLDVSEPTNLFIKSNTGSRVKILYGGGRYRIGNQNISKEKLLDLMESEPERFSTNAAARCIVQNLLFPVLAYVAGPNEIAYHHQLKDYHACYGIKMPWVLPRMSMTVVPPAAQEMMKSVRLRAWDPIPMNWSEIIPELKAGEAELVDDWTRSAIKQFGNDLSKDVIERYAQFQVGKLHYKAVLSRLKKRGIASHTLHYLRNLLNPHKKLQERVLNWWEFQTSTEISIIHELLKQLDDIPRGHLYCYL